jgi:hypothetical protein
MLAKVNGKIYLEVVKVVKTTKTKLGQPKNEQKRPSHIKAISYV